MSPFHRDPEGETYRRVEQLLAPIMLGLSLLFVPVILGPLFADLSADAERWMFTTGAVLWAGFVVEYVWLLYLAPSRGRFVRSHKLKGLIVLLPVLRPLQIFQLARLAPAASGVRRALTAVGRVAGRPGVRPYLVLTGTALALAAWFVRIFEHEQPGATIDSYRDGLWWAIVTTTTVGYGDRVTVTGGGQIVAVVLMLVGIGALSLLTASVAALFLDEEDDQEFAEITERLDRIEALLLRQSRDGD